MVLIHYTNYTNPQLPQLKQIDSRLVNYILTWYLSLHPGKAFPPIRHALECSSYSSGSEPVRKQKMKIPSSFQLKATPCAIHPSIHPSIRQRETFSLQLLTIYTCWRLVSGSAREETATRATSGPSLGPDSSGVV